MPSSPNYVRDYKQEVKTSNARGEIPDRAARNKARAIMVKKGAVKKGDGKDVDHKKTLNHGGAKTALSNLQVLSKGANRSFKRTSSGAVKKP